MYAFFDVYLTHCFILQKKPIDNNYYLIIADENPKKTECCNHGVIM